MPYWIIAILTLSLALGSAFTPSLARAAAAPVITDVRIAAVGPDSVRITWRTDILSMTKVWYSTVSPLAMDDDTPMAYLPAFVTYHNIEINDLEPSTTYYFHVVSASDNDTQTISDQFSFTTKPPGPPDVTAPVISQVGTGSIKTKLAHIVWKTDEPAGSKVWYSTTSPLAMDVGDPVVYSAKLIKNHDTILYNLAPGTTYYYHVASWDKAGNFTLSDEHSFTTIPLPPLPRPAISTIRLKYTRPTEARITWQTDEPALSRVWYDTHNRIWDNGNTPELAYGSAYVTSHDVTITDLEPNTTYYYQVVSATPDDSQSMSREFSFTTKPLPPPDVISPELINVAPTNVKATTAHVTWKTNEPASGKLWYSTTSPLAMNDGDPMTYASAHTLNHDLFIRALQPDTTYYFHVFSYDPAGNGVMSPQMTFKTLPVVPAVDTTPPNITTLVSQAGTAMALIGWNTNEPATSRVWYGTATPLDPDVTTPSVSSSVLVTDHQLQLTDLLPNTTYYFIAESIDASGNITESNESFFTTEP